jgi:ABC-type glycerol-3-phosphate transport system permease component
VANIWLFFYTPQYGLLEQVTALFGLPNHNWLGSRGTALACLIVVTIWKEAGFFMIFYLAALQSIPPSLYEAAALEGASRWTVFRRLHVSVADADDAVRARERGDQFVPARRSYRRDDAGRSRQHDVAAALLHLRGRVQVLGRGLRRGAYDGAARSFSPAAACCSSASSRGGFTTDEPRVRICVGHHSRSKRSAHGCLRCSGSVPLAYAVWTAFHPAEFSARFVLTAPLTLDNFRNAWEAAPLLRATTSTPILLVTLVLAAQLVLCTLAAYAFARYEFPGRDLAFALVLVQLMIMPDVLIVENYRTMSRLGILDSTLAIGLPYMASAFGVFLLRQTFKTIPRELDEAARVEGASGLQVLLARLCAARHACLRRLMRSCP